MFCRVKKARQMVKRLGSVLLFCLAFITVSPAAIIGGNPRGNTSMVEVYDYQCPHCRAAYPIVTQFLARHHDIKVRYMPVAVVNQTSIYQASAAIATTAYPNKFAQFHAVSLTHGPLSADQITALLGRLHLDTPAFFAAMHSQATRTQLLEGLKLAREHHGVPLFIFYRTNDPAHAIMVQGEPTLSSLEGGYQRVN